MRAWRVHELGAYRDVLRWEDCPDPPCPENGVRLRVRAAGLNFPDLLAIAGKYQVKQVLPFTPGLEAAGVVESVGAGSRYRPGQRVVVFTQGGAYAELVAAPDERVFPLPDSMNDEHAAGFTITYQTSFFALVHRTRLAAGEWLLVHGAAGGVGTAAIQIGKALGARVIATAGGADKLEVCRRVGADYGVDYRQEDFGERVREITGGHGADVIYDPVGGDVFDQSIRCLAWSGRLLVIGFTSGRIPSIAANRILLKNISIIGVHWGAYVTEQPELLSAAHSRLCEMYVARQVEPIIWRTFRFDALPEGLAAIESRSSYGKVILSAAAPKG
jgi:NADPH2:quinone reductase